MPDINDILGDPDYQALKPDDQFEIRRSFYKQHVAPDPDFQALAPEEKLKVKNSIAAPGKSAEGESWSNYLFRKTAPAVEFGLKALSNAAPFPDLPEVVTHPAENQDEQRARVMGALSNPLPRIIGQPLDLLFKGAKAGAEKIGGHDAGKLVEDALMALPPVAGEFATPGRLREMSGATDALRSARPKAKPIEEIFPAREPAFVDELEARRAAPAPEAPAADTLTPAQRFRASDIDRQLAGQERLRQSPKGAELLAEDLGRQQAKNPTIQEIVADPDFQKLDQNGQAEVKRSFLDTVVRQDGDYGQLDDAAKAEVDRSVLEHGAAPAEKVQTPANGELAPALQMGDGRLLKGNPGDPHSAILDMSDPQTVADMDKLGVKSGWVDAEGKFLTNEQAAARKTEQPAPRPTRQRLDDTELTIGGYLRRNGVNIPPDLKEEFGAYNRFHSANAMAPDEIAHDLHAMGMIENPTTASLLDALRNGGRKRIAAGPAAEDIYYADKKIDELTKTPAALEYGGKEYEGAERLPGGSLRLKDHPDKVLQRPSDILKVEEKVPFDIPPEETGPMYEQTAAGKQAVIPGTEGRTVPSGGISSRRRQTEAPTDLERATMPDNQPTLESAISKVEERQAAETAAMRAEQQRGSIDLGAAHNLREAIRAKLSDDVTPPERTKQIIRSETGAGAQRRAQREYALRDEIKRWDKASARDSLTFIDAMESGREQAKPADQAAAAALREELEAGKRRVQALGKGKLEKWIENYFPHIWADPKGAEKTIAQIMGRRPLEGSKAFLKKREIPTTVEGVERGLTPVTWNPVRLALLKLNEMDKYVGAHRIFERMKKEQLTKFVRFGGDVPEGWAKLDDKIARVFADPNIPIAEAFDQHIMRGLNDFAKSLDIAHTRKVKTGGEGRWGYTSRDVPEVVTKFGGPEFVLTHEIGHQLDFKYGLAEMLTRRGVTAKELRALADLRFEGMPEEEVSLAYRRYVRQGTEKIANLVHAMVHAPDKVKAVAPTTYKVFNDFIKSHDELKPLLDIKPSLVLDSADATVRAPGAVITGEYYAPRDVAKIFNNYLSPGLKGNVAFDTARQLGNTLNQAQLGLSLFHAGFTSIDAITSDMALAVQQTGRGALGKAALAAGRALTLTSPIENWITGNRLLKEYLDPGSYTKLAREAKALADAGGRAFQDDFYTNQAVNKLRDAIKSQQWGKAGLQTVPAALELAAKPVMEWIVPRQKLGVFAKMASDIVERADRAGWDDVQWKQAVQKAWDSVDNRMGQIVYDNLFWNRTTKDLGFIGVRSLGWNIGTVRELGGGLLDIVKAAGQAASGGKIQMTPRIAYVVALPMVVGYMGALTNYLFTGEPPQELRDYFFPRTGGTDQNGRPERVSLPSYMKDVYAFAKKPAATVGHKLHPLLTAMVEMIQNQDFYGTEIRHVGDPLVRQAMDVVKFAGAQMLPFSFRNAQQRAAATGEDGLAGLFKGEERGKTIQSFFGVTPAPASVNKTGAEELASEFLARRTPAGPRTEAQAEQRDALKLLETRYRAGKATKQDIAEELKAGRITETQVRNLLQSAKEPPLLHAMRNLRLDEAVKVWDAATPREQQQILPSLLQKVESLGSYPPEQQTQLVQKIRAIVKPERSRRQLVDLFPKRNQAEAQP